MECIIRYQPFPKLSLDDSDAKPYLGLIGSLSHQAGAAVKVCLYLQNKVSAVAKASGLHRVIT